ncbi:MAG: serine/threonine-protein kinase [Bryobacteraceae bacterium]
MIATLGEAAWGLTVLEGTLIGRYQIQGELGSGGMSTVYRADDPVIGRSVAVKIIRWEDSGSPEQQRQLEQSFQREIHSAGVLQHPGVVRIYDAVRQERTAYIIMELVEGQTLDSLFRSEPRPVIPFFLSVCRQTAAVLDFAHARGVIHRDIKPTNILVTPDGTTKICDFGIAKVSQAMTMVLSQTGVTVGTPDYMSPEQVLGKTLDGRTDQWSLAVVACMALSGLKPFRGDSFTDVMTQIVNREPQLPRQLNPGLPPDVDKVLARAFSKDPAQRFPNCTEFITALEAAYTGAKTQTIVLTPRQEAETEVLAPPAKRSLRIPLLIGAVVVLAALGAILALRHSGAPAAPVSGPVTARSAPEVSPALVKPTPKADSARPARKEAARVPASAAAQVYTVHLNTTPPDAAIIIDGKTDETCQSPCESQLSAGRHSVLAKKDGFYPVMRDLVIGPDQADLSFSLVAMTGSMMLETTPSGASISINGEKRPETTPASIKVPVGQYKVTLGKEGYQPMEFNVSVRADQFSQTTVTLAKTAAH